MCLAQGPQRSDASEAGTRGPSVSSQALYHWATAFPTDRKRDMLKTVYLPPPWNSQNACQNIRWRRPWSACFFRSSLIRVCTVCLGLFGRQLVFEILKHLLYLFVLYWNYNNLQVHLYLSHPRFDQINLNWWIYRLFVKLKEQLLRLHQHCNSRIKILPNMVDVPVFLVALEIMVWQKRIYNCPTPRNWAMKFHQLPNQFNLFVGQYLSSNIMSLVTSLWHNYLWTWQPPFYECQKANDENRQFQLIVTWIKWKVVSEKYDWQSIRYEWMKYNSVVFYWQEIRKLFI